MPDRPHELGERLSPIGTNLAAFTLHVPLPWVSEASSHQQALEQGAAGESRAQSPVAVMTNQCTGLLRVSY